jgi:hypothetical protein
MTQINTLPQTRFWLQGLRPIVPLPEREGPRDSDGVTRVFMLEAINRVESGMTVRPTSRQIVGGVIDFVIVAGGEVFV